MSLTESPRSKPHWFGLIRPVVTAWLWRRIMTSLSSILVIVSTRTMMRKDDGSPYVGVLGLGRTIPLVALTDFG